MGPRRNGRLRRRGQSVVEILVACTVMVLVIGAVANTLVMSNSLSVTNAQTMQAALAARSTLELLKGTDFEEVFARFNATADDDPGAGDSPGIGFAVDGFQAPDGDADGLAGRIEFPGDGIELREDAEDADLGMPRDLNRDGEVDKADHAASYTILPVRIVIEWRGQGSDRSLELVSVLTSP